MQARTRTRVALTDLLCEMELESLDDKSSKISSGTLDVTFCKMITIFIRFSKRSYYRSYQFLALRPRARSVSLSLSLVSSLIYM
jgi:hypothetical protein